MSHSLQPREPQHARTPCPSPTPGVHSNSCPSSRWCHPTVSSSVVPFSSCPQSFPASGSFQMSQLSASGGQSLGASASASVLPMNTQDRFPLGWTGWISLQSKGLSRVFSNTTVEKHQFFSTLLSLWFNSNSQHLDYISTHSHFLLSPMDTGSQRISLLMMSLWHQNLHWIHNIFHFPVMAPKDLQILTLLPSESFWSHGSFSSWIIPFHLLQ